MMVQDVAKMVGSDSGLEAQFKSDPTGTLKTLSAVPLQTDVWIYRIVVAVLGLVILSTVVGAMALSAYGKIFPEAVIVLAGTCAGAMAGLLAPSPRG